MKFSISVLLLLLLSGCGMTEFSHNLASPFTYLLNILASIFHQNYGIAIIALTLSIRLLLMPMMMNQTKQQQKMKELMDKMKPQLEVLQEKLKQEKDPKEQQKLQLEMMNLYKESGISPLSMGCLPLLIQMPVLMGVYYAIISSNEIATHSFLWFNLGTPDVTMAILASAVSFIQTYLSLKQMPKETQQGGMKLLLTVSPIVIGLVSMKAPAALPLYWTFSGLFLLGQNLLTKHWVGKGQTKESLT